MGHYLSEMEGEPFTTKKKINKKIGQRAGKIILKDKKFKFTKIQYCEIEWITTNPKRKWINVHYQDNKYGDCIHSANYDKYQKYIEKG